MLEREGMRPLAFLEKLEWVGEDVWYAHGIHFNDEELRLLAQTGTGVAHCPASNMKLSSGVCRVPDMLELGVPLGLALDGSASNDGNSLLEELRVAYLLHRLTYSGRAPSGYDLLKIATRGGARLLGRTDIGSLEVGKCADLFLIDSRRLELVGACFEPEERPGHRRRPGAGGLHRGPRSGHRPPGAAGPAGRGGGWLPRPMTPAGGIWPGMDETFAPVEISA